MFRLSEGIVIAVEYSVFLCFAGIHLLLLSDGAHRVISAGLLRGQVLTTQRPWIFQRSC